MERQQILDLYKWALGICFRHPARGEQPTTVVKTLHPRGGGDRDVRACEACVVLLEAERESAARIAAVAYVPGPGSDEASPSWADGSR